jgi:GNAT superfamily N-acetyltransferase
MRWQRDDGYVIDDDPAVVDRDRLHVWLDTDTYWWPSGLRREVLEDALAHSLTLTAVDPEGAMVGFGRAITDRATFAFLADVYIDPDHRGRGLGGWLTEHFVAHPELSSCRRLMLATRDAHGVYAGAGFTPLAMPDIFMEISRPGAGSPAQP